MNIRRTVQVVAFVASVAYLASSAAAEIIPVEPFTGALTETWESFPTSEGEEEYLPDPSAIMGGAATISNPHIIIYEPGVWAFGLGSSGYAQVSDGAKGMGLGGFDETATVVFNEPVLSFGAYWGAWTHADLGGDPALISVSFFDDSDDLIGTEIFEYSRTGYWDGLLQWHGWASSIPVKTIVYSEDKVAIDGLQADPVPEPAAHILLGFAGLMFLWSRQRLCRRGRLFCWDGTRGKRTMQVLAFVSALTVVCSAASGEIIPIEPFTGDLTETWESFETTGPEGPYLPNPTVIMGGAASISNDFMAVYEPGIREFGLGSSGNAAVADGQKGMGIERLADTAVLVFQDPVLRFGAYWGAWTNRQVGGDPALIGLSFFDVQGNVIGADVFEYSRSSNGDGILEWHGWLSTEVGIRTITYTEDKVVLDGLQAEPVPEPATILLLVASSLLLRRRNRRPSTARSVSSSVYSERRTMSHNRLQAATCRTPMILLGLTSLLAQSTLAEVQIDTLLLIDGSGSVEDCEWAFEKEAISKLICANDCASCSDGNLPHDSSIAIGVIQFAGGFEEGAFVHIPLTTLDAQQATAICMAVDGIDKVGGGTPLIAGLQKAREVFEESTTGATERLLIILTDVANLDPGDLGTRQEAEGLRTLCGGPAIEKLTMSRLDRTLGVRYALTGEGPNIGGRLLEDQPT